MRVPDRHVHDGWSLLDELLNSEAKIRRFALLVLILTGVTVVAIVIVVALLLVIPQTHLVINWGGPIVGVAATTNALLVRRLFRVRKQGAGAQAQNSGSLWSRSV